MGLGVWGVSWFGGLVTVGVGGWMGGQVAVEVEAGLHCTLFIQCGWRMGWDSDFLHGGKQHERVRSVGFDTSSSVLG